MRARNVGTRWEVLAPAKLNLYLEILGRRDDGFHELETLMTPVRIFDRLRWTPQAVQDQSFSLVYDSGTPAYLHAAAPPDQRNLVWRAFDLLGKTAGIEPWGRVTLEKRIPVQAGLGGASSDAAAALQLANAAWGIRYPLARLAELGAQLGSDVPFFFAGGAAICRGRGEQVKPIAGLPPLNVVVAKPAVGVSTAAAFGSLAAIPFTAAARQDSEARLKRLVDKLRSGSLAAACQLMANRLQDAAQRLCPEIASLRRAFQRIAPLGQLMTGSGSAVFAVMRSARQARQVAQQLSAQLREQEERHGASSREGLRTAVFAAQACCAASSPS
jgi:4-diphosphocytidyl-2-C-methyl-D-erythritol kinase